MKKMFAVLLAAVVLLTGCGHPLEHQGKVYPTYGLFNENTAKSSRMCYELSVGNVVWSIITIETVVLPVYFIGFSLFNPVGPKSPDGKCGIDNT